MLVVCCEVNLSSLTIFSCPHFSVCLVKQRDVLQCSKPVSKCKLDLGDTSKLVLKNLCHYDAKWGRGLGP